MSDTTTVDATACPAPAANPAIDLEHVAELADSVSDLVRAANRGRQWWLAAAAENVEWSTLAVLRCLHAEGPMRSGAIAESLGFDPSTVSRQVATLVRDGMLERRADPDDGRASLLVLTARADAVLAEQARARVNRLAELVADWPATELEDFSIRLRRFVDAYDRMITERSDEQHARSRSNH